MNIGKEKIIVKKPFYIFHHRYYSVSISHRSEKVNNSFVVLVFGRRKKKKEKENVKWLEDFKVYNRASFSLV